MSRPHVPTTAAPIDVLAMPARRTTTTVRTSTAHHAQLLHRVQGLIRSERGARTVPASRVRA